MYIRSDLNAELPHEKPAIGSYEWWYFDAISADKKWSFVIIFYDGNPFSPAYIQAQQNPTREGHGCARNFPAISVSVYNHERAEYYSFLEYAADRLAVQSDEFSLSLGSNIFERRILENKIEYEIILNQMLDSGYQLRGRLKFVQDTTGYSSSEAFSSKIVSAENKSFIHSWNLLQPRAGVMGNLNIDGRTDMHTVAFNGLGYHDHNIGHEPLKDSFDDWYWGRIHFTDYTLVYYLMNTHEGVEKNAWLLPLEEDMEDYVIADIELSDFSENRFGLKAAKQLTCSSKGFDLTIRTDKVIDDGPFYQRFYSEASFVTGSTRRSQRGISEYIKPSRIAHSKYWWLVNMRLRYLSKKPHWVQKSRLLYPRTW